MNKRPAPGIVVLVLALLLAVCTFTVAVSAENTVVITGEILAVNPPVAGFSGNPLSGTAPLTVQFSDQSTDNPTSWKWEYRKGYGGWTQFSTEQNPSYSFTSTGAYSIRLTAANAVGSDSVTRNNYITVTAPHKPIAQFTGSPTSGMAPLTVQFSDQSTNSPTSWTWEYRKGYGGWTQFSSEQNPSYSFTSTGTYSIRLTAANAGGSDSVTRNNYITVTSMVRKPVALFIQDQYVGRKPLTVTFTDRSQNGPTDYLWSFGDGVTSTLQNPVHTYTSSGLYSVQLTASNTAGSDTARSVIFVLNNWWW